MTIQSYLALADALEMAKARNDSLEEMAEIVEEQLDIWNELTPSQRRRVEQLVELRYGDRSSTTVHVLEVTSPRAGAIAASERGADFRFVSVDLLVARAQQNLGTWRQQ